MRIYPYFAFDYYIDVTEATPRPEQRKTLLVFVDWVLTAL